MKNTSKLKVILQLYVISLDMDDDNNLHLTLIDKRTHHSVTFMDKAYTSLIGKAYRHMAKEMKIENNK